VTSEGNLFLALLDLQVCKAQKIFLAFGINIIGRTIHAQDIIWDDIFNNS